MIFWVVPGHFGNVPLSGFLFPKHNDQVIGNFDLVAGKHCVQSALHRLSRLFAVLLITVQQVVTKGRVRNGVIKHTLKGLFYLICLLRIGWWPIAMGSLVFRRRSLRHQG